jgi:peptidoglycan hydrolase CwlO-like protein
MFTSCKDYDDDINNIVATKADKTELQSVKQALEDEISGLKDQLQTVNGQITNLTNKKADKFTEDGTEYNLETVWTTLKPLIEKEANLRGRLGLAEEAIQGINTLIGGKISDSEYFKDCKNYYEALEKVWAKCAALDTQLGEAVGRIEGLEADLNTPTTGLKAVVADLTEQVNILNGYKARVETIEADYLKQADKQELITKINNEVETLNGKIATLRTDMETAVAGAKAYALEQATEKANAAEANAIAAAKKYTDDGLAKMGLRVDSLAKVTKDLSDRLDNAFQLINDLNVYVRQALRGLVFNMDSYYAGVEATDLTVLWYKKYTLKAADADTPEEYGYNSPLNTNWSDAEPINQTNATAQERARLAAARLAAHKHVDADYSTRYIATDEKFSKVLKFQAKYYMNPSNAKVSAEAGTVKVIATDKPYHSGLETGIAGDTVIYAGEFNGQDTKYEAGLKVVGWETKNGQLIVDYDCTNPNKIRSIRNNQAITIFATQVNENDTMSVTSDFAALYKQDVKDLRISHTPQAANGYANHNGAMIHNGQRYGSHSATKVNAHCGYCSYNNVDVPEYAAGLHLMQTVAEAAGSGQSKFKASTAGGFDCQDSVGYKDTLDLLNLVEIHYTTYDANGEGETHTKMPADMIKAAGLKFRFALTGLWYGSNGTSESAHAAIKTGVDEDGNTYWWLRPQMPDSIMKDGKKEGVAAAWNATRPGTLVGTQQRQTIGRTPLVRVELVMPDATDPSQEVVVDYGYIRVKIVEHPTPEVPEDLYIRNYPTPGMTASEHFCKDLSADPFNFEQRWIEMEYDIHSDLDLTQQQFENDYVYDGDGNIFKQFYLNEKGIPTPCTSNNSATDALGTVTLSRNYENEQTSIVKWTVTDAQLSAYAKKIGGDESKANVVRVVRFEKRGTSALPLPQYPTYIYISFTPASFKYNKQPKVTGTLFWENEFNRRNTNNWYAKNANGNPAPKGLVEIHVNTLSPEDSEAKAEWTGFADSLTTHLPDVFTKTVPGSGVTNKLITPTNEAYDKFITVNGTSEISGKNLTLDLVFADSLKDKVYPANNGVDYKLEAIANGKALGAYKSTYADWAHADPADRDTIAIMYFDQPNACDAKDSINHWQIGYRNKPIADALLNYKAHNELADDVITAVVAVKAIYKGATEICDVPLYNNSFNVRFLRPINVKNVNTEVGDAYENGLQIIYLRDCVQLSDWRDVDFKTPYWSYYQIKFIEIADVAEGGFLADNPNVLTDIDAEGNVGGKPAPLQQKNALLDLKYLKKPSVPVCKYESEKDYGSIVYSNFSNPTQDFHLWLPLKITYLWGDIYTTVEVTVNGTLNNARQAK